MTPTEKQIRDVCRPIIDELAERFAELSGAADDYADYMRRIPDALTAALAVEAGVESETLRKEFGASARALHQLATNGSSDDLRQGMYELSNRMFRVLQGHPPSALTPELTPPTIMPNVGTAGHPGWDRAIARAREITGVKSNTSIVRQPYKFQPGDRVRKHSGSWWEGRVVGYYSTKQTPRGYCVQLDVPNGPVQIYPEAALEPTGE